MFEAYLKEEYSDERKEGYPTVRNLSPLPVDPVSGVYTGPPINHMNDSSKKEENGDHSKKMEKNNMIIITKVNKSEWF